jgi:hypothetical protein
MALQFSVGVRNAKLDAVETTVSTAPTLALFSGAPPASCATANSGTLIALMTLPSDWMDAASSGTKAKAGTWQDTSADDSGTIGHFRIFASGGTCHIQGTCANSGADMNFDNNVVNAGQQITVSTFVLTSGNA